MKSKLMTVGLVLACMTMELGMETAPTSSNSVWQGRARPGIEVRLDEARRSVHLSVVRDPAQLGRALKITLIGEDGRKLDVQLNAMDPKGSHFGQPAQFSGTFGPGAGSFVGFELRFPGSGETTQGRFLR